MSYHRLSTKPSSRVRTGAALCAEKPRERRSFLQSITTTTPTTANRHHLIPQRWAVAVACVVLLALPAIELSLAATTLMLLYGPSLF
jgi:hypothetical protein